MKIRIALSLLLFINSLLFASELNISTIRIANISGSINPAILDYLTKVFNNANKNTDNLILIKMNTPGGLVSATKDIVTLVGNSSSPVALWITPEGASATSAGAIVASASHFIFMSDGTNIGAATPIELNGDIKGDQKNKAINDLVALVQSLSETRGRNTKGFSEMISKAASFTSLEATKNKIVDGIANTLEELIKLIDSKEIFIKGQKFKITISDNYQIIEEKMTLGESILNIFANPSFAYILFLIGAALIYLEFQAPGGYIAGASGIIALILSGIAFQILPVNFGSLGLIILAFILFILEIYVISFGIISIIGIVSLFIGSSFLYNSENSMISLPTTVIYSSIIGIIIILVTFGIFFFVTRRKKIIHKDIYAKIVFYENDTYYMKYNGQLWKVIPEGPINLNDEVLILRLDDSKLAYKVAKK